MMHIVAQDLLEKKQAFRHIQHVSNYDHNSFIACSFCECHTQVRARAHVLAMFLNGLGALPTFQRHQKCQPLTTITMQKMLEMMIMVA